MAEGKQTHLIEVDLETQSWIEEYAKRADLSMTETLERLLRAGRSMIEKQAFEMANVSQGDAEIPIRLKIGVQASVECLSILRQVYLPNIELQKKLALDVKAMIEKTIEQIANHKENHD